MVQINILSARVSLHFTGNKPAISAFDAAEVKDEPHRHPKRESVNTLVEEKASPSSFRPVDWVAGVGDICATDGLKPTGSWKRNSPATSGHDHHRHTRSKRTALQRHCDFWDADHDGLIYPTDIYTGFRKLGFNIALCLWAAVTMALCSSYSTQANWLPHPLFAINVDKIHRSRHGSTTATYDLDAEIDVHRFDSIFTKYAEGKDYLTRRTLYNVWAGQCCANDWFGWFAGGLECEHVRPGFSAVTDGL
jgi:hypothetical protein